METRVKKFKVILLAVFMLAAPAQTFAITAADQKAVVNDTTFYDPEAKNPCSTTSVGNPIPAGSPIQAIAGMGADGVARIVALLPIYQQAAQQTGVPWQILASIDYREDNNSPTQSMLGGEPLGSGAVDSGFSPTTKLESILDGITILKGKQSIYGVDPTKPLTVLQLQELFITYNRGNSYAVANESPALSPYVMNQFDATHTDMTFPNIPGETLAGHTEVGRLGAYTVYTRLPGGTVAAGAGTCATTAPTAGPVVAADMCKVGPGGAAVNAIDCAAYWAAKIESVPTKVVLMNPQFTKGDLDAAIAKVPIHNSDTCGNDTYLHFWLLWAIYESATAGGFTVGLFNIVSGHGCDQFNHPIGRASDVGAINGVSTSTDAGAGQNNRAFAEYIGNILPHGGEVLQANKCFPATLPPWISDNYDTCTHIHIGVGRDTP